MTPLLEISDYRLVFDGFAGTARVLDGVSLRIEAGESVGIVGETGCGKSVLARSIARLVDMPPGRSVSGAIRFEGEDVLGMSEAALERLRGSAVSMIFQDPMTYLNPLFTIGSQMADAIQAKSRASGAPQPNRAGTREIAKRLLTDARLPDAAAMLDRYPHELSGGMRQRVLIAMALAGSPKLIIADEPTTALDVTIQAQILSLIAELMRSRNLTLLLISHDLGVIGALCKRVAVMYAGVIVEDAPAEALFARPRHPYTRGLLAAVPDLSRPEARPQSIPGHIPDLVRPPDGCRFHPRCAMAAEICRQEKPAMRAAGAAMVACHHADVSA